MNPQNLIAHGVRQHLDHAGRVAQGTGPAVGQKRKGARLESASGGLELLLSLSDPCDFRVGVNHPRNGVEINMPMLAGHTLGHRHALFFGFVRQHRAAHHIAHCPNPGKIGSAISVDHNGAPLIERQPDACSIQALGVWHPADRDDQFVNRQSFRLALGIHIGHINPLGRGADGAYLNPELDLQALLVKRFFGLFGNLLVHPAQKAWQAFEYRDTGTQTAPDRTHLQANHTRANQTEALGQLSQGQRALIGEYLVFIKRRAGQGPRT